MTAAKSPRKACRIRFSFPRRPWSRVPLLEYPAKHRTHEVVGRSSPQNLLFAVSNGYLWPGGRHPAGQRHENGWRSSGVEAARNPALLSTRLFFPYRVARNRLAAHLFGVLYAGALLGRF